MFLIHLSSNHGVLLCPGASLEGARGWGGWGIEGLLRVEARPVIQRSSSCRGWRPGGGHGNRGHLSRPMSWPLPSRPPSRSLPVFRRLAGLPTERVSPAAQTPGDSHRSCEGEKPAQRRSDAGGSASQSPRSSPSVTDLSSDVIQPSAILYCSPAVPPTPGDPGGQERKGGLQRA